MRFSVGQVLATAFRTFARRYGQLFGLVVFSYALIVGFWFLFAIGPLNEVVNDAMARVRRIHPVLGFETISLGWIPLAVLSAAITIYVVGRLRDEPVAFWRAFGRALRRIHVLVVVAFVLRLSTTGAATLVQYLRWEEGRRYGPPTIWDIALSLAMWIIASALLVAVIPVATVERRGAFGSVARAWRLARGDRFKVIAIVLVFTVLSYAINYTLFKLMLDRSWTDGRYMELYTWVRFGIEILIAPLYPVVVAITYEKLRLSKEGPADSQLGRVFA
jgi:hypothetical protein